MEIYLAEQTRVFLQACLTGALLGLLYDVFRISRIAFPLNRTVVFVEDMLFFFFCAVITFFFMLQTIEGQVRVFILIGELIGAILYYFTLGQLIMKISKAIIAVIKAIILFIFRWIFRPVWRLIYGIITLFLRPFRFLLQIIKKSTQKVKFRLKIGRIVLYNHYKTRVGLKRTKKTMEASDETSSEAYWT